MATAGALLGLRVPGILVEDVATTAKTLPGFADLWAGMLAGCSLSRRTDRLDEDDIRVRAQRGKSRPRSKVRPGHEDAGEGFVVAVDRGRLTCVVGERPG